MSSTDPLDSPSTEEHLFRIVNRAGARTAAAVTRDGRVLDSQGDTGYLDTVVLATMAASMFSSARELALILEEDEFRVLIHQGEKRHLMVSLVNRETMLVVVFEDISRLGRIRIEAEQLRRELTPSRIEVLGEPDSRDAARDVGELKEFARGLIDQIFRD